MNHHHPNLTVTLSLISHTNVGKTTLARTLLRMGKISLAETELRIILRQHQQISPATQALVLLCLADAHDYAESGKAFGKVGVEIN